MAQNMDDDDNVTSKGDNDNSKENEQERKNLSLATKDECVKFIRASLAETCQANKYKEDTLKAFDLRQLQAMALSMETLVEKIYYLEKGARLAKGVGVPTHTIRNATEMILKHNEECIREAKRVEQEAIDKEMENIADFEELEDLSNALRNDNMGTTSNNNENVNLRKKTRMGGRGYGFRNNTKQRPPLTGNKRGYKSAFGGNNNNNNNNKDKKKDGPTKIPPSFEKIWEKVKKAEFEKVKVYKDKQGKMRYFWWQNGKPAFSDEPPIGNALGGRSIISISIKK